MRLLIAVASKHGATAEIGAFLEQVWTTDFEVDRIDVADRVDVADYDAAIIGSAVYAGRWMKDARRFVKKHEGVLHRIPVWLFSSGPLGDPPEPDEDPTDVADIEESIGIRGHVAFPGKLDTSALGFAEKAMVKALRVSDGDFRDWESIREWAEHITTGLTGNAPGRPRDVAHG